MKLKISSTMGSELNVIETIVDMVWVDLYLEKD